MARETLTPEDFAIFINVKVETSQGGNNALLYAIGGQNTNSYMLVHFLIVEAHANCNLSNDFERNSLLIAARRNQLNVVELLLKNAVDINFADANGCNALHVVCTNGFVECAELLLSYWYKLRKSDRSSVFNIDVEDSLSLTSLMKASINNHLQIVQMLLNYGASPRKTTLRGESALTLACMQENAEICERLIIAKANVNELDNHQRTPLLKAARHNSKSDIVRLLLKHGAKPDIADEEGNTPLHFAA